LQLDGPLEPFHVEGGLIEIEQAVDEAGVVDGKGLGAAFAFAPGAVQAFAGRGAKLIVDELRGSGGERDGFGIAKGGSGTGEAGDGESVPGGDDFVVEMRTRALGSGFKERSNLCR
jgi:hypothetical protein